jgi:diguanylate cyclase (GGDEF)-like protein
VLAAFGDVLRRRTRATDVVARFGGEEFVVLMSATELEVALGIAERIRTVLAASHIEPLPEPITASFGVAERAAGADAAPCRRRALRGKAAGTQPRRRVRRCYPPRLIPWVNETSA